MCYGIKSASNCNLLWCGQGKFGINDSNIGHVCIMPKRFFISLFPIAHDGILCCFTSCAGGCGNCNKWNFCSGEFSGSNTFQVVFDITIFGKHCGNGLTTVNDASTADGNNDVDRYLAIFTGYCIDRFCCWFTPNRYSIVFYPCLIELRGKRIKSAGVFKRFSAGNNEYITAIRSYYFMKIGKCTSTKNNLGQAGDTKRAYLFHANFSTGAIIVCTIPLRGWAIQGSTISRHFR